MQPADPAPVETKSIFTSRTFAGLALIVLPIVVEKFGIQFSDTETQQTVQEVFAGLGSILAAYGRIKAKKAITITPATDAGRAASVIATGLFVAAAFSWLTTACAGTTRAGRVTNAVLVTVGKFAGKVVLSSVANAANDRAAGVKIDLAHSASTGLWTNLESAITAQDITRIVDAWSAGAVPSAPLAAQWTTVAPATNAERAAVVNALARGISDAALRLDAGREGKAVVPLSAAPPFRLTPPELRELREERIEPAFPGAVPLIVTHLVEGAR